MKGDQSNSMSTRFSLRGAILCSLLTFVVGTTVGLLLGYFLSTRVSEPSHVLRQAQLLRHLVRDGWGDETSIVQRILDGIDPERIRQNLKILSAEYHVAGTDRDEQLAEYIRDTWIQNGLHSAELVPYEVLLSLPKPGKNNTVQVLGSQGKVLFSTTNTEPPLRKEDKRGKIIPAFHAYSPSGSVEGQLVYLNFGEDDDIMFLQTIHNISLKGKIALVREGGGRFGGKVKYLYEQGVVGVISFPAPTDFAKDGGAPGHVYPHTTWLPSTGIVRSSAALAIGDPLTPGFPSIKGALRLPIDEVNLPPIPSQPISYGDAQVLMSWLGGKLAPDNEYWVMPFNDSQYIGPGFADKSRKKVRLTVNNEYVKKLVPNVIGTIRGDVEPDRYVILGNHRDSWGFGAIDPSSGTAMMMELVRVLGQLTREGWKPRRTLVFCSWAAEEFGLIGSTEWVEDKLPKLQSRAVAYLNTDICVMGTDLDVRASPILTDAIFQVTKMVPDPVGKEKNLYDSWLNQFKYYYDELPEEPEITVVSPISDFASFAFTAGIPIMDVSFKLPPANQTITSYPMYHTGYETFYMVDKFVDPTFKRHQACGHVTGLMMHYLADSAVLPYNLKRLSDNLVTSLFQLNMTIYDPALTEAIFNFSDAIEAWHEHFSKIDRQNPIDVRMFNDQLMNVERSMTSLPMRGDPSESFARHRIYLAFASVEDIMVLIQNGGDEDKLTKEIERHLSDLTIAIHQAEEILESFSSV